MFPISEPSLRRAYGPMLQFEPTVADERWLKDSITELSPMETPFKMTEFEPIQTLSPMLIALDLKPWFLINILELKIVNNC